MIDASRRAPSAPDVARWSTDSVTAMIGRIRTASSLTTARLTARADGEDAGLGGIHDCAEARDAEHAEIRDREGPALDLRLLQLARPSALDEVARLARDLAQALLLDGAQDGDDQTFVECDRDADVGALVEDERAFVPAAVELRVLDQGERRGSHHEVVDADLLVAGKRLIELFAQFERAAHVDLGVEVEVRHGRLRFAHATRHRAEHRRCIDDLVLCRRRRA